MQPFEFMPDSCSSSRSKIKPFTVELVAKQVSGNAKTERSPPILRPLTELLKLERHAELSPITSAPPAYAVAEATFAVLVPTSAEPQTGVNPNGVAAIQPSE